MTPLQCPFQILFSIVISRERLRGLGFILGCKYRKKMEQSRAGLLLCPSSLITVPYAPSLDPTHPCQVLRVVDDRRLAVICAIFAWYPSPSSQPPLRCLDPLALDFLAVLSISSLSSRSPRPGLGVLPIISTSSPWSRDPCRRLDLPRSQCPRCRLSTLAIVSTPSPSSQRPRSHPLLPTIMGDMLLFPAKFPVVVVRVEWAGSIWLCVGRHADGRIDPPSAARHSGAGLLRLAIFRSSRRCCI